MKNFLFRFMIINYISINCENIFLFICKDLKVLYDYKIKNDVRILLRLFKKLENIVVILIKV